MPVVEWDEFVEFYDQAMTVIEDSHEKMETLLSIVSGNPEPSPMAMDDASSVASRQAESNVKKMALKVNFMTKQLTSMKRR